MSASRRAVRRAGDARAPRPPRVAIVEEGIRYGANGDGMSFYIRDPSGNQIELKGPIAD
jgi:hypothetical protein